MRRRRLRYSARYAAVTGAGGGCYNGGKGIWHTAGCCTCLLTCTDTTASLPMEGHAGRRCASRLRPPPPPDARTQAFPRQRALGLAPCTHGVQIFSCLQDH